MATVMVCCRTWWLLNLGDQVVGGRGAVGVYRDQEDAIQEAERLRTELTHITRSPLPSPLP